jgi:hypothetical protein
LQRTVEFLPGRDTSLICRQALPTKSISDETMVVVAPLLRLAAEAEKAHRWWRMITPTSGLARWNTALVDWTI